jgi:hypothetical protein
VTTAAHDDAAAAAPRMRVRVARGGEPTPEEAAALVAALQFLMAGAPALASVSPAQSEWALQGRMGQLGWQPLSRRWPGEPPGRAWRRVTR